jgi:hypothetical protein
MASGMLTKQADFLTAKFLNDVNDANSGGVIVSVPTGAPSPAVSQTIPGDRIVVDDPTALALSDTVIGTLYGGVYSYVQYKTTTRPAQRGGVAFFHTADIGVAYIAYGDPDPSAALPTHIYGIWISAPTANNYCWIQVAGAASVQFDNAALGSAADGQMVSAKISSANATSTTYPSDSGATVSNITVAALIGVACGLPSSTVISTVMITRGLFCGRI